MDRSDPQSIAAIAEQIRQLNPTPFVGENIEIRTTSGTCTADLLVICPSGIFLGTREENAADAQRALSVLIREAWPEDDRPAFRSALLAGDSTRLLHLIENAKDEVSKDGAMRLLDFLGIYRSGIAGTWLEAEGPANTNDDQAGKHTLPEKGTKFPRMEVENAQEQNYSENSYTARGKKQNIAVLATIVGALAIAGIGLWVTYDRRGPPGGNFGESRVTEELTKGEGIQEHILDRAEHVGDGLLELSKGEGIQEHIRQGFQEMWPMLFGTPRGEEKVDSLFGNNPVTSKENPLLTDEDRARALEKGVQKVGAAQLKAHLEEHMEAMEGRMPTLAEWYHRIAECSLQVCPVILGSMITAHVEHVSRLPHDILLFDFDSSALRPEGDRLLEELATELTKGRYRGKKVVVEGRGSKIGDKMYNRDLSKKRADTVKEKLAQSGIRPNDVTIIWLGWEPPQLTTEILEKYKLVQALRNTKKYGAHASPGDLHAINQSTMVIIY